jgi:hypothetical protein
MALSITKQLAGLVSGILLVGSLGAGCMATEPEPAATTVQDPSNTTDLTRQDDANEVENLDGTDELFDSSAATETIELAGTAPTCVFLSVDSPGIVSKTVRLTNNCSFVVRVRVDISFAPDLPCISMSPGQRASWKVGRAAVIAGVNNC